MSSSTLHFKFLLAGVLTAAWLQSSRSNFPSPAVFAAAASHFACRDQEIALIQCHQFWICCGPVVFDVRYGPWAARGWATPLASIGGIREAPRRVMGQGSRPCGERSSTCGRRNPPRPTTSLRRSDRPSCLCCARASLRWWEAVVSQLRREHYFLNFAPVKELQALHAALASKHGSAAASWPRL